MARPALLVVDPDSSRRRELARGLSGFGYEVVPAVDADEGRRFARGLGPSVVVAASDLPGMDRAGWDGFAGAGAERTLLLLGGSEEEAGELPQEILFLAARGLAGDDLVRRVRLVLLGREIGVEPDARLESLVGDLSLVPFLELLRSLHRAQVSGRLVLAAGAAEAAAAGGGEVELADGEVVRAVAGPARGEKAFFRLARREAGPFHVVPAGPGPPPLSAAGRGSREIEADLTSLLILAIEDLVHGAPGPEVKIHLSTGPAYFATPFTASERQLLAVLTDGPTVGEVLDTLAGTDGEVLRDLLAFRDRGLVTFEEPRLPVTIVTDSAADLPADLARAHGIEVVPIHVLFGDEDFKDGVDLAPREFYDRLERGGVPPRTRPPEPAEIALAYRGLAGRGELLSIHLSEKLSQTVVHARAAAEGMVQVVDSGHVSLGLGLLALFAARLSRRGVGAAEIAARLAGMRSRLHVLFVVDTLDYLARGGRIGRARAVVGNLLGIKPILGVLDGEVAPVDRVRGGRAAHLRLVELFRQRVGAAGDRRPVIAGIAHAKAPVWADRLRDLLAGSFEIRELLLTEMGPVVGTHGGPGTVGVALFAPTDEELPLLAPLGEGPGER
ncbi:MAG TPA: DegV family protein [Thermoanaerobaculia bacterium]|nr:DegV family protein [Thermoanaerobaculia bacterium]